MYKYRILWRGIVIDEVADLADVKRIINDLFVIGMNRCELEVI